MDSIDILSDTGGVASNRQTIKPSNHPGQVAMYLMMSLVAIFMLTLLAVDVFLSVRTKNRLQNGGDAAALAAARRQGEILNEIGRLNLEHIKAALEYNTNRCIAIGIEQRRLALLEPVYALRYASRAAKRNDLEVDNTFSKILMSHVDYIRNYYVNGASGDGDLLKESYPGAWNEYANAIYNVVSEGLSAGADNIEFYTAYGSHPLYNPAFYNAIAGEDWCWFYFNDKKLLDDYKTYNDWGEPQVATYNTSENSEIFSLHLSASTNAITDRFTVEELVKIANEYGNMRLKTRNYEKEDGSLDCGMLADTGYTWFFFSQPQWGVWFNGRSLNSEDDVYEFPIVGSIKDEYNVRGCAAVCRTRKNDTPSFSTDSTYANTWSAAAKPFGTVESLDGNVGPVTGLRNFVVPCMTDVRLVSIDSVSSGNLDTANLEWFIHIRFHLRDYLMNGPKRNRGCWFCAQLKTWEKASFHHRGTRWLKYHSGQCLRPVDGHHGGRGGTSHGR